jgi:uncharacterized protein (TIGR01777 family)
MFNQRSPQVFVRRTRLPVSADEAFRWHERPGAIQRLIPPWERAVIVEHSGIHDGAIAVIKVYIGPVPALFVVRHSDYIAGRQFRDTQVEGPFARWEHTHSFEPDGEQSCVLEDRIEYELPGGPLGEALGGDYLRSQLERLFDYRHRVTAQDLAAHASYGGGAMKILLTGSHGLVGSALNPFLTTGGHSVEPLRRRDTDRAGHGVYWNPAEGSIERDKLEGVDCVVHLAGEGIVGAWDEEKKRKIRDSRVNGTRLLSEALAKLERRPRALVSASAIGYYGSRGDEVLTEESPAGNGFLSAVSREWEAATAPAAEAGIRVVNLRFGVILSPRGGALEKILLPFRFGLGGEVGGGRQYWSWIAIDDAVGAIHHALITDALRGPSNAVAPHPVTNHEFTKTLGSLLSRPTLLPTPEFAARLAFGEMADELLLAGARVEPARLLRTGYRFRFQTLEEALRHLLGQPRVQAAPT